MQTCPLDVGGIDRSSNYLLRVLQIEKQNDSRRCNHVTTVHSKVIIEDLKERERVPSVGELLSENGVHIDGEEGPEDLGVLHQKITEPGEGLDQ